MLLFNDLEELSDGFVVKTRLQVLKAKDMTVVIDNIVQFVCYRFHNQPIQDQYFNRIKISQLVFKVDQLTGSYVMGTLIINGSSS